MIYKIAVTGGHDKTTPGKRSPDGKYLEYAWNDKRADAFVAEMNRYAGVEVRRFDVQYPDVAACNDAITAWGAHIYIDFHDNGVSGGWRDKASGVSTFCRRGDKASHALAEKVGQAVSAAIGLHFRGTGEANFVTIYGTYRLGHGGWHKNKTPYSFLIEWGFHTSRPDIAIMTDPVKNAAGINALGNVVAAHFGLKLKASAPTVPPIDPHVYFTTTPQVYTLYAVGKKFGVPWESIRLAAGGMPDKNKMKPDMKLLIK